METLAGTVANPSLRPDPEPFVGVLSEMSPPLNPWKLTGYKAGQNVACKVMAAEPGGYSVILTKDNLPGFLPTEAKFRIGEELLAQFVCVHNNRVLLSSRSVGAAQERDNAAQQATTQRINWQEQLSGAPAQGAAQPGTGMEQDAAFGVWSQQPPRKFHLKRATDLILPPMNGATVNSFKIAEYDLEWLITDLEGGMRTGCVKASSEERLSRSAMLLYRGRAVGCIYGRKNMTDQLPTEQSLMMMMEDLALPETKVSIYDLPEAVTLAMSALFLGYPVQRSDDLDARSYMDYLCGWFTEKLQTACLALSLPSTAATCLGFVHQGQWAGSFYVEDQNFTTDKNYVYQLLASDPQAGCEASILPPEMTSAAVRFGFSLSMSRKKA